MDEQRLALLERAAVDVMVGRSRGRNGVQRPPPLVPLSSLYFKYARVSFAQSPPYAVTEEQRRQAEAAFMELKNAKLPYETCKYILGTLDPPTPPIPVPPSPISLSLSLSLSL